QVIADQLHVPLEQVRVLHGDTAEIDRGTGTFASRSMMLGGGAAVVAAREWLTRRAASPHTVWRLRSMTWSRLRVASPWQARPRGA
ncbi:MAG TPA: molybdopterin cofactor-binding domain-containing protein, partial [Chloroflexota bacterium]|nr:molybdopterin cofactor-binding domain-containing protein [Chloroflexota bacterium]